MQRVALTGNIASGKSAVAAVWKRLGAHVIDADELARRAVEPGSGALAEIARRFGSEMLADGELDRARLRARIFNDAEARAAVEAIVHPEIARLREAAETRLADLGASIVVHEIPLLFETGLDRAFDTIVLVDAPAALRERRLVEHRGIEPAEARRMMAAQSPAAAKRVRSHIVIDNTGSLAALESAAAAAWRRLAGAAA